MMFDTSTQHAFAPLGALGHQPGPYQQFGQPPMAGFVPIIGLVPQSSIVNLVAQSLQQAQLAGLTQQIAGSPLAGLTPQSLFGHVPGQFGPPQFGQMQPFGQCAVRAVAVRPAAVWPVAALAVALAGHRGLGGTAPVFRRGGSRHPDLRRLMQRPADAAFRDVDRLDSGMGRTAGTVRPIGNGNTVYHGGSPNGR